MKLRVFQGLNAVLLACAAQLSIGATISPQPLQVTVAKDQQINIIRQVVLDGDGPAASKIDVFFLADNTGSMSSAIRNVRNNAADILQLISGGDSRFEGIDVEFGVASYNGDPREFGGSLEDRISRAIRLEQPITSSQIDTQNAINQWRASGGGDGPEANFFALHQLATNGGSTDGIGSTDLGYSSNYNFGWRDDALRLIIWFGDYRSHTSTVDQAEVIAALQENKVIVAAINISGQNSGIDTGGEAQAIVDATQGYIAHNVRAASQTVDAILSSVQSATQTVDLALQTRNLPDGVTVDYSCASDLGCDDVSVGESRDFTMTITGLELGQYEFETYVPFLAGTSVIDNVRVRACLTDLDARGSRSKISVTWEDTGAISYNVYRSLSEAGDFELIGNTTSRYSTYGDRNVIAGTTYYYQVKEVDANGHEYCESLIAEASTGKRFRAGPINLPPEISSSPALNALEDTDYRYEILASDPEGGELDFTLVFAPTGMTISNSGVVTWTPLNNQIGENTVSILVSDSEGLTDSQTFTIVVQNVNDTPDIISSPNSFARVGEVYRYAVQATDEDFGDTLAFELLEHPATMSIDANTGLIQWTPSYGDGPSAQVTVRVTDAASAFEDQTFVIEVDEPNREPSITTMPINEAQSNVPYSYDVDATDPDAGDTLSYRLSVAPTGMTIESNTGLIEWLPTRSQVGIHPISVVVEDASGQPDVQSFEISVSHDNSVPVLKSTPAGQTESGSLYSYDIIATDADGDALTYSLKTAPQGMTLSSTGALRWTPTEEQVGSHSINVAVTDGFAEVSQSFTLAVVTATAANAIPEITSQPTTPALVGQEYRYDLTATDADGDALTFSLSEGPAGMTVSNTGALRWTPADDQVGSFAVAVAVSDGQVQVTQSYTLDAIVAVADNNPPVISSLPTSPAIAEQEYRYDIIATDADGDTLSYSLIGGPDGMSLSADGKLRWTPTQAQIGSYAISLVVSDGVVQMAQRFTLEVIADTADNTPPAIASVPSTLAIIGEQYLYNVQASDVDGNTLIYGLLTAPEGMSMSPAGQINWLPTPSQEGHHAVSLYVSDGLSRALQSFTLTASLASDIELPYLANVPTAEATVNQPYNYKILALDANGYAVEVELVSGPQGMQLVENNGFDELLWTPTEGDCIKDVTIRLTDYQGQSVDVTYSITVRAAVRKLNRLQCSLEDNSCGQP